MANKEDAPPRGNEWEVVSLTSSAYAAAPSPYNDPRKYDSYYGEETSRDLFMSDHFVFPPSEHENLPLDDNEPLLEEEEQQRIDYQDSMMMLDGQGLSDDNKLRFHDESAMYEQQQHGLIDDGEAEEEDLVLYSDNNTVKLKKDAKSLPCEAWWRRRALRTREAKAIWSLFFAATVTGLVVLGQRWQQQERWQVMQLKWQSSISSEKLSRVILQPLSRLKDVIVRGSNSQASLIRSGSSTSEI